MKADSSQSGMKKFFLYHVEKLILGTAIVLMGVFFWMGYRVKPFADKTPTQLRELADEANRYIVNPSSWEQVVEQDARRAYLDVVQRIQQGDQAVDISKIPFGIWSIRAKTLDLRRDPQLVPPSELVASHIRAPLVLEPLSRRMANHLAELPLASAGLTESGQGASRGGREGDGSPAGRGAGRGAGMDDGLGDLGGDMGIGGDPRGGRDEASRGSSRPEVDESEPGMEMLVLHEKFFPGIRPPHFGLSDSVHQASIFDAVVVTGLIEIQKQHEAFKESFADSIGYFPDRDRIDYRYLQVERRKVAPGEEQAWEDITEQIQNVQQAIPNSLVAMPNAEFRSAPEVIDEGAYDPILTMPIPAFTNFDYRSIFTHPKVDLRVFDPLPEVVGETFATTGDDLFGRSGDEFDPDDEDDPLVVRAGSDVSRYRKTVEAKKPPKEYKVVRFFDLSPKVAGETYQYRVRAWLFDPNHEPLTDDEPAAGPGGRGPGGRGAGGRGGMLGGDLGGGAAAGGRGPGGGMGDPRGGGREGGFDPRGGGAGGRGGMLGGDLGGGGRGDADGGFGAPSQGGRGGGSTPRGGGVGGGDGGNEPDEGADRYVNIPITPQMKHPDVRFRLGAAKSVPDEKDKTKVRHFIQEEGYEEPILVPENQPDLRMARPTAWSEVVEVTIRPQGPASVAGEIEYSSRAIKIGNYDIFEVEPVAELILSSWNRVYRALLPARKIAHRGELLEVAADAHVINPVTWNVHLLKNAPVLTDSVLVDFQGGNRLPVSDLVETSVACEMLIMGPDGKFSIANDMDQRTQYKQLMLHHDDSNEVGQRRTTTTRRNTSGPADRKGGR